MDAERQAQINNEVAAELLKESLKEEEVGGTSLATDGVVFTPEPVMAPPVDIPEVQDIKEKKLRELYEMAEAQFAKARENLVEARQNKKEDFREEYQRSIRLAKGALNKLLGFREASLRDRSMTQLDVDIFEQIQLYESQIADLESAQFGTEAQWVLDKIKEEKEEVEQTPVVLEPQPEAPIDLEAARNAYVLAKGKLDRFKGVKELSLTESREKIEQEFKAAEEAYKKARAEYIANGALDFDFIKRREDKIKQRLQDRRKLGFAKAVESAEVVVARGYDFYKSLGKYYIDIPQPKGRLAKIVPSRLSLRTGISLGLMGGSLLAGPGVLAGGMVLSRRLLSGTGTAVGSYDLMNLAYQRIDRKGLEKSLNEHVSQTKKLSLQELGDLLNRVVADGQLDGKNWEQLNNDPMMRNLSEEYALAAEQFVNQREAEGKSEQEIKAELVSGYVDTLDKQVDKDMMKRRLVRVGIKTAAVGLGVAVGSGEAAKLIGKIPGVKKATQAIGNFFGKFIGHHGSVQPNGGGTHPSTEGGRLGGGHGGVEIHPKPTVLPTETPPHAEVPGVAPTPPTEHILPINPHEAPSEILINSRGIEGTLLDQLKGGKHQDVLEWLQKNYPSHSANSDNSPGALVHRFVLDHHSDHDLNRILTGSKMGFGPHGEVILNDSKLHFMPAAHEVAAPSASHLPVEASADVNQSDIGTGFELNTGHGFHPSENITPGIHNPVIDGMDQSVRDTGMMPTDHSLFESGYNAGVPKVNPDLYNLPNAHNPFAVNTPEVAPLTGPVSHSLDIPKGTYDQYGQLQPEVQPQHFGDIAPPKFPEISQGMVDAIAADPSHTTSEAIQLIWGHDRLESLLHYVNLAQEQLDGFIGKATVGDLHMVSNEMEYKKFLGLDNFIQSMVNNHPDVFTPAVLEKMTVRDFLIKQLPKVWR